MEKRNLLTLSVLGAAALTLASCKNSNTVTTNIDAYSYDIAKTWFANGEYTDNYFTENYTTEIYDPSLEEGFSSTSYYTLYAYKDVEASLRMVQTEINASNFESTKTNYINYLECSQFSSTYQSNFVSSIVDSEITLGGWSKIQDSWQKSFDDYKMTDRDLDDEEQNYLYVIYMPVFVRVYSSSTLSVGSFICVPVYVTISTGLDSTINSKVTEYKDKIVTPTYSDSIIK